MKYHTTLGRTILLNELAEWHSNLQQAMHPKVPIDGKTAYVDLLAEALQIARRHIETVDAEIRAILSEIHKSNIIGETDNDAT